MQDQEILQMINVVLSSGIGVDPNMLNEFHMRSQQFQSDIIGFQWSMHYLSGSLAYKPALYALLIIKDWMINRWDEINSNFPNLMPDLYQIVFETSLKFLGLPQNALYTLYKVQTLLSIHIYQFRDMFTQIFNINHDILFPFLDVLFSTLKDLPSEQANILAAMEEYGLNQHLLSIALDTILTGRKESLNLLLDILTWVTPEQIRHPAIDTILNVITMPEQAPTELQNGEINQQESQRETACKILDGLLGSPMGPQEFVDFIGSKEIIARLQSVETEDENILSLVACLYSTMGKKCIDFVLRDQRSENILILLNACFQNAMNYLGLPNEFISESVIDFIKLYVDKFADANNIGEIVQLCFQRFVVYFSTPTFELSDFAQTLLNIIVKHLNSQQIVELLKIIDNTDLLTIGAYFNVALHMRLQQEAEEILIDSFSEIITNITPPAEYPEYLALTQYIEFVAKKKSRPIQQDCLNTIASHAVNTDNPAEYAPKFSALIKSLMMKGAVVNPEIPYLLISTGNQDYAALAARTLKYVPQESVLEAFNMCKEVLASNFHGLCLPFIEQIQLIKDPNFKQSCFELINFFISTITEGEFEGSKDSYMARAIASMWNVLDTDCLQIFVQLFEYVEGLESMAQMCNIASQMCDKTAETEWIAPLFAHAQNFINEVLSESVDWSDCNEFAKQSREFMKYYFKFVTKSMRVDPNVIIPETIKMVLHIVENLINVSEISMDALTFVYSISDEYFGLAEVYSGIQELIRYLILCAKNLAISDINVSWRRVMRQAMKIIAKVYNGDTNTAVSIVERSLYELGLSGSCVPQLMEQWRAMMERGPSQIDSEVGSFYANIRSALNGG